MLCETHVDLESVLLYSHNGIYLCHYLSYLSYKSIDWYYAVAKWRAYLAFRVIVLEYRSSFGDGSFKQVKSAKLSNNKQPIYIELKYRL